MNDTEHDMRVATVLSDEELEKIAETVDSTKEWKAASVDARKELVENLKEAIRLLQWYLIASLTAAGAFAALAWASVDVVQVPMQLLVPISRAAALLLLGAVYFVTGLLASLTVARANRICLLLAQSTDDRFLLEAVLLYPSIPTIKVFGPRVGLSLLPPILVVTGIVKIFGNEVLAFVPIVGMLMLCIAPFVIAYELRYAVGEKIPSFPQD